MEYLLYAVLIIVVYAEVLPTISVFFELIRNLIAKQTLIIQQSTVQIQEDIQNTQARMEQTNTNVIGFQVPIETEMEDDYEPHYKVK